MNNICVGKNAGLCLTTGHHNILIGENAGSKLTTESYILCIAGVATKIKDEEDYDRILLEVNKMFSMFSESPVKIGNYLKDGQKLKS